MPHLRPAGTHNSTAAPGTVLGAPQRVREWPRAQATQLSGLPVRPMKTYVPAKTCTRTFTAALLRIAPKGGATHTPIRGHMVKKTCSHARENYAVMTSNDVWARATWGLNPKNIGNENSQTQRAARCRIAFIRNVRDRQMQRQWVSKLSIRSPEEMGTDCSWVWPFCFGNETMF